MRHETIHEHRTQHLIFDSLADLIDSAAEGAATHKQWANDQNDGRMNSSFVGRSFRAGDFKPVIAAVHKPWTDGIEIVEQMLKDIADEKLPKPYSRRRRLRWNDEDGLELDIDRLRSGQPYWRRAQREASPGPTTVTILTDISTPSSRPSASILWRGAAAIALTRMLELAGYSVELRAFNHCTDAYPRATDNNVLIDYRVKRADRKLNITSVVNAVSGWFYRTVVFSAYYTQSDYIKSSLGRPASLRGKENLISRDERTYLIDKIWDKDSALTFLRQALSDFRKKQFATN